MYESMTGIDLTDIPVEESLQFAKTPRIGLANKNESNARRQALIRIMFNVLSQRNKNDKNFIRKLFNYGCHCYPGGPSHLLKSGYGKPLDEIDSACQKHKNCYKCLKSIFNEGTWAVEDGVGCNPETTAYKMTANIKDYSVQCRADQTACRKALCECDLEFAKSIAGIEEFDLVHNHTYLERNGFKSEDHCQKRGLNPSEAITCCGNKKSFPYVEILTKNKDQCCEGVAFNSNREECCAPNVVSRVGKCYQYVPYGPEGPYEKDESVDLAPEK